MSGQEKILDSLILELRRGTLVLSVLSQLKTPHYGYSLSSKLKEKGLNIEQNTLYPLLRRLEKQNLLDSRWALEESRQRRYYVLSDLGKEILEKLTKEWNDMGSIMNRLLMEEEEGQK